MMEENSKYDIFISYSSHDRKIVHDYALRLEELGYKVWYDVKGLYTGADFSQEIVDAIENSNLFLFFSSKESNDSTWTRGEILAAHSFGKKILPIKIDKTDYDRSIMLILLPLHFVSLCDGGESFNKLINSIEGLIGTPENKLFELREVKSDRIIRTFSIIVSLILSMIFSWYMMKFSQEHRLNYSLTRFTLLVSVILSLISSAYVVFIDNKFEKRSFWTNLVFIIGLVFFVSYTTMALGLGFARLKFLLHNLPSILCSILSIVSVFLLVFNKKIGYVLLWTCAILFSIGSFWWLNKSILFTLLLSILSIIGMCIMTFVLKIKHHGISVWDQLT